MHVIFLRNKLSNPISCNEISYSKQVLSFGGEYTHTWVAGFVRPMIAKHAGRNREMVNSYQHRRRVHIKLL